MNYNTLHNFNKVFIGKPGSKVTLWEFYDGQLYESGGLKELLNTTPEGLVISIPISMIDCEFQLEELKLFQCEVYHSITENKWEGEEYPLFPSELDELFRLTQESNRELVKGYFKQRAMCDSNYRTTIVKKGSY